MTHSTADAARILRERAEALARSPVDADTDEDVLDVVGFTRAGERYTVEARSVSEVLRPRGVVPVPRTPPHVVGIVNHRGRILVVLDIGRLFGLSREAVKDGSPVVVVTTAGVEFAIAADTVTGSARIAADDLTGPTPSSSGNGRFLRGVTPGLDGLLDVEALARHPDIVVDSRLR
jgi:purine-binding chemotaxis protein CheW